MTAGYTIIGNGLFDVSTTSSTSSTSKYLRNIFGRLVSETPLHRLNSCVQVFFACWCRIRLLDFGRRYFSSAMTILSLLGQIATPTPLISSRVYRVSGTNNRMVRKFSAVRITAIHLCQRQLRFVTMKPQISGPNVLPPAIAFI